MQDRTAESPPLASLAGGRSASRVGAGLRYMAVGAFWFSVMSLLVKLAGARLPSQEIVLARAVSTLALSWAMVRRAGVAGRALWGRNPARLVLRGTFGCVALSCFYYSLVHLPIAEATIIQYMNPVFTAVLAGIILGERMGRREVACVVLSLFGVALVTRPGFLFGGGGRLDPVYVGIALLGALCSAAAYTTIRTLRGEHSLVIVFYLPLVTVPFTVPLVWRVAAWPTPLEWVTLLAIGFTTQAAQVYLTRGLQLEPAGRATAVGYLQIVFAAVWGVIFFREYPDGWSVLGALLIVGSTLALVQGARREAVEVVPDE